jgi:hypothetical protein
MPIMDTVGVGRCPGPTNLYVEIIGSSVGANDFIAVCSSADSCTHFSLGFLIFNTALIISRAETYRVSGVMRVGVQLAVTPIEIMIKEIGRDSFY